MKILQADPGRSYQSHGAEISKAVQRVLESGWYILGKEVERFEKSFAKYVGCRHSLGVANGTDALELILRSLDIGVNDKVATVANTAVATISAIERTGAQPRFVDIDPDTYTMSSGALEELLGKESGIRAVIVVHLFGCPADLDRLSTVAKRHNVFLIEDCAQAHGAEYKGKKCGSIGIAAGFSFYPTKNLGAFGDGGCIITNDEKLFQKMFALRQYGWTKRYISEFSGINSRLDELQATILAVKLPLLDAANMRRREIAEQYRSGLAECPSMLLPFVPAYADHVYHQFVIRVKNGKREQLKKYLTRHGIGTAIHYPQPVHQQEAYRRLPKICTLKNTEEVNDEILSLPMYPELTDSEVSAVIVRIKEFFT